MEKKMNFLLMGKTGHGKSLTGNCLLNRKVFKTSSNTMPETKKVDYSFSQFGNYIIRVVDGPGLEDITMNHAEDKEEAAKNMDIALGMCHEGVDAFLFVTKFGNRFTKEDQTSLEALKRIFGEEYMKHVIVIVTCGDLFKDAMEEEDLDITFQEWCRRQTGEMQMLYRDCNGRFVLFNNREKYEEKKKAQIQEVLTLAEELQIRHGRYNSECFEKAKTEREKLIIELKAPLLTEQIQEKICLLIADIEKFAKRPSDKSLREYIVKRIQDLKEEIKIQDKGYGVLGHLTEKAEEVNRHLNDTDTLLKLAAGLEITRKARTLWTLIGSVCTFVSGVVAVVAIPVGAAFVAAGAEIAAVAASTGIVAAGIVAVASAGTVAVAGTIAGKIENAIQKKQIETEKKRKKRMIKLN